jgi:hypothetical protein
VRAGRRNILPSLGIAIVELVTSISRAATTGSLPGTLAVKTRV